MITAAQIFRATQIWLFIAVVFVGCVLAGFVSGPWNYCWLFAIGCWAVLNVYWGLAARDTKLVPKSWLGGLAFVARVMLYCLPLSSIPILGQRFMPRFAALEILGAVLCAVGVGVAIWSRRILAESWSPVVALRDRHALVQAGPYAIIRHPIYFGFMMSAVGMILVLGEIRALVLLFDIGVFFRRLKPEESLLRATYPNEYPEYERRVKRLLPCVW
jgi:protein-S-isoprenylcysteine O-methyltransferase Ste14